METGVAEKLIQLNLEFYKNVAKEFSASRQYFQPGWQQFWKKISLGKSKLAISANLKIFDLGCGNGRFLDFLQKHLVKFQYLGIDGNLELLKIARQRFLQNGPQQVKDISFLQKNIFVYKNWLPVVHQKYGNFDVIVCFAVLHHIPGYQNRFLQLQNLAELLNPKGFLIFSLWNFIGETHLREHIIPWKDSGLQISKKQLESHDFLLTWGNDLKNLRYCHNFAESEIAKLIEQLTKKTLHADRKGLKLIHYFRADGRNGDLNHYLVFQVN